MGDVRLTFAEALSEELGVDMSPAFLLAVDRLLTRMWLSGLIVQSLERAS